MAIEYTEVLNFWFGKPGDREYGCVFIKTVPVVARKCGMTTTTKEPSEP